MGRRKSGHFKPYFQWFEYTYTHPLSLTVFHAQKSECLCGFQSLKFLLNDYYTVTHMYQNK